MNVNSKQLQAELCEWLTSRTRELGVSVRTLLDIVARANPPYVEKHPLGFLAIRFHEPDCTVRIHIWAPETWQYRDPFGAVHDHIWTLESHILKGSLQQQKFELSNAAETEGENLWIHDYKSCQLRRTEMRVRTHLLSSERIEQGQSYHLPAGTLHSTAPLAERVVTLVRMMPTLQTEARIVGDDAMVGYEHSAVRQQMPLSAALGMLFAVE